jgi:hypothetical protein
MKKAWPNIALLMIILVVSLPLVQMKFQFFKEKPLDGAFVPAEMVKFVHMNWSTGLFQEQTEKYLKDHTGFRASLVRLQNQIDYSLFRQANAEGAIVGKNGQLFEYDYIRSWLAFDHPGESFIRKKLGRVRFVQDYLKHEKGIDLVVVFEPGKASFYPEHIPAKYARQKTGPSLYETYVKMAQEAGIDYIDLQEYFIQLKEKSPHPLFPGLGTHWSVYGMTFAADSLLKFIEGRRGIDLAPVTVDSVEISHIPRDTDDDVAKTMNLFFHPNREKLAYPFLRIDTSGSYEKPMVLVVADSYYWNIFNTRIPKYVFANEAFWYFNALVYPDFYGRPVYTHELDLRTETEKQDIIFLMVTERFLHKFDWQFADQLYKLYTPEWLKDPVYDNINDLMRNDPWFNDILDKARQKGISLESALHEEGRYMIFNKDTAAFLLDYGPEHYLRMISENEGWMGHIREKAEADREPVEETLMRDALYVFKQDHPELYELNRGIATTEEAIRQDSLLINPIIAEALQYRFDPEILIRLKAKTKFREQEIARISDAIRNDAGWLSDVRRKAGERNIPLEEMIRLDATWVLEQKWK